VSANPILDLIGQRTGQTLDQMLEAAEHQPPGGKLDEVPASPEFRRIQALPRRQLGEGLDLVGPLSQALKTPQGEWTLRPIQALALAELIQYGSGGFFPIVAGEGKTLITYLAPVVCQAKRPLLLVPASLRDKTRDEFYSLAVHWAGPHPAAYRITSFELLGRPQSGRQYASDGKTLLRRDYLDEYAPDLVVMDELHKVKDQRTAVCKRVRRYLRENPHVRVVAMSGTVSADSIKDYAHVIAWCLPKACPVPKAWKDLDAWAGAIDHKAQERVKPGALLELCDDAEKALTLAGSDGELEAVRMAYSRRLGDTPGVVSTYGGRLPIPLILRSLDPGQGDPVIEGHFENLRRDWITPDGWELVDGIAVWRCARELALGFHYVWDPRPPREWRDRRSAWAKFCRNVLEHNRRGWDSEKQVKDAIDSGAIQDGGLLAAWREIEPTFTPNTVPVWHSAEALDHACEWLEAHQGIVWTEHTAFARKLAKVSGVPYYGRQGKNDLGQPIEKARGAVIASIASSGTGRNLQAWSKNLIMSAPQSALRMEQLLARTHRPGQTAAQVETWIYAGCWEHIAGFSQALEGAKYQKATLRSDQRLLYSEKSDMVSESDLAHRPGRRWKK
jgi:hypothetical protein